MCSVQQYYYHICNLCNVQYALCIFNLRELSELQNVFVVCTVSRTDETQDTRHKSLVTFYILHYYTLYTHGTLTIKNTEYVRHTLGL